MSQRRGPKDLTLSIVTPAPGDLRIVQELMNTADLLRKTDELESPRALADWLVARDLLAAGIELTPDDLALAVGLREGLRALAAANNGAAVPGEVLERLERVFSRARFRVALGSGGLARFVPASGSFHDAIGCFAEFVATAQARGEWPRLKACAHEACRGVFYDASKNRSGKWCSKRRCGARLSSRAYRRRRAPFAPGWLA